MKRLFQWNSSQFKFSRIPFVNVSVDSLSGIFLYLAGFPLRGASLLSCIQRVVTGLWVLHVFLCSCACLIHLLSVEHLCSPVSMLSDRHTLTPLRVLWDIYVCLSLTTHLSPVWIMFLPLSADVSRSTQKLCVCVCAHDRKASWEEMKFAVFLTGMCQLSHHACLIALIFFIPFFILSFLHILHVFLVSALNSSSMEYQVFCPIVRYLVTMYSYMAITIMKPHKWPIWTLLRWSTTRGLQQTSFLHL